MRSEQAIIVLGMVFLSGCAGMSSSSIEYSPPKDVSIQNEKVIQQSFDRTWDNMIENLSGKYFVINNVEKESRIINVSFSSQQPHKYIDCGLSKRTFTPGVGLGEQETYQYETAVGSTVFKATAPNPQAPNFNVPFTAHRKTSLEGRTNIYVAPGDKNATKISVNTRYVFTISSTIQHLVSGRVDHPPSVTVSFNTNEIGKEHIVDAAGSATLQCVSKGVIERDILQSASS